MKAWGCNDYNAECGYIVFAETRGKAHSIAMGAAGFDCSEWNDVQVKRMPTVDGKQEREGVLEWRGNDRIYYEAGWFESDNRDACDWCDLCEYESIPESRLTETDDGMICAACIEHEAKKATKQ